MKLETKVKGDIMTDFFAKTSVANIWNGIASNKSFSITRNYFIEISHTERNVILVVFDHDLSKKPILISDSMTDMDLENVADVAHLKYNPLLYVGYNYLLSIAYAHGFVIAKNRVDKHHSGKQCIHDGYQTILMKSYKDIIETDLIHVPIWEPNKR